MGTILDRLQKGMLYGFHCVSDLQCKLNFEAHRYFTDSDQSVIDDWFELVFPLYYFYLFIFTSYFAVSEDIGYMLCTLHL